MSIIAVNLTGQSWDDAKDGSRSYVRRYDVHTDDPFETMVAVRAALPLSWEADPVDGAAIVVTRTAEQDPKARKLWRGEVTWTWEPEDDDEEDPLNREPAIDWTSNTIMLPAIKDRDGDAVVNSAGDYFDPPPEREVERWLAQIEFNATSIPSNIRRYKGAVNTTAVLIDGEPIAAERAKIVGLTISKVQYWGEGETPYRTIRLSVECRDDDDDSFDLELLDQGYRKRFGTTPVDIYIEPGAGADPDEKPQRTSVPVLLNGEGDVLDNPTPSTAVFLQFPFANLRDLTIFPGIEASP